jgi:hypothetical protein
VIYTPNDQSPSTFLTYMVRTVGDPATAIGSVREALRAMDPLLPMIRPQTLEDITAQSPAVFRRRYPSYLIGSFAALALVLAMVGLYGMISYIRISSANARYDFPKRRPATNTRKRAGHRNTFHCGRLSKTVTGSLSSTGLRLPD